MTLPPMTVRETARLAGLFCILWFIANWTLNASLDYTSVASSTILASMSGGLYPPSQSNLPLRVFVRFLHSTDRQTVWC